MAKRRKLSGEYANIRNSNLLGDFIGRTVIDITQHDQDEFRETGRTFVMLMFDDGSTMTFPIGDMGFEFTLG